MASRVVSLSGNTPDVQNHTPCPRHYAGEALKLDYESILSEPVPERFSVLIRQLRKQEMLRSALIATEHCLEKP